MHLSEGKQIVGTLNPVLDHVNVVLNFWDMFILSTRVKTDTAEACLERLKFWVGKCCGNLKTAAMVGLNHMLEAGSDSGNLMVW